jgi:hypothetical protein
LHTACCGASPLTDPPRISYATSLKSAFSSLSAYLVPVAAAGYFDTGTRRHKYQSKTANAVVITTPRTIVSIEGNIVTVLLYQFIPLLVETPPSCVCEIVQPV